MFNVVQSEFAEAKLAKAKSAKRGFNVSTV